MRKTIVLGALAALFGFAALAQASDQSRAEMRDGTQVTRTTGKEPDRDARKDELRERRDVSGDKQHAARESHDDDEATEHRDRR